MSVKFDSEPFIKVKEGTFRKIIHTQNLMTVLIDFTNGPWNSPDPPHSHPHEQTAYVEQGDILFFCDDKEYRLKAGDMYAVPPNKSHSIQLISKRARIIDNFTPLREDFLV